MVEERKPDNRIWWVVGIALVLLLVLCLCVACVAAAGAASLFYVRTSSYTESYSGPPVERVVPVPEISVPVYPIPAEPEQDPDFRMARGAHILSVAPGSPADAAGLRAGDIITMVDGRALGTNYDLTQALSGKRAGEMVTIEWWSRQTRGVQTVRVQLGSNPDGSGRAYLGIEYRMRP